MSGLSTLLEAQVTTAKTLEELRELAEAMHAVLARVRALALLRPGASERVGDDSGSVGDLRVLNMQRVQATLFDYLYEPGRPAWTLEVGAGEGDVAVVREVWSGLGGLGACATELWRKVSSYLRVRGDQGYVRARVERVLLARNLGEGPGVPRSARDEHDRQVAAAATMFSSGVTWYDVEAQERALERFLRAVQHDVDVGRAVRVPLGSVGLAARPPPPDVHVGGKWVPVSLLNYLAAGGTVESLSLHAARVRFVVTSRLYPALVQLLPSSLPLHERESVAKQVLRNTRVTQCTYGEKVESPYIGQPFFEAKVRAEGPGLTLSMSANCQFEDYSGYHEWVASHYDELTLDLEVDHWRLHTPSPAASKLAKSLVATCVASHTPYNNSIKAHLPTQEGLGLEDSDEIGWARQLQLARAWAESLG